MKIHGFATSAKQEIRNILTHVAAGCVQKRMRPGAAENLAAENRDETSQKEECCMQQMMMYVDYDDVM